MRCRCLEIPLGHPLQSFSERRAGAAHRNRFANARVAATGRQHHRRGEPEMGRTSGRLEGDLQVSRRHRLAVATAADLQEPLEPLFWCAVATLERRNLPSYVEAVPSLNPGS